MMHNSASLLEELARFMESRRGERGLVAVSGGADSVGLLLGLLELPCSSGLVVAHANHGLRGAESDGDEEFVRELAAEKKLPFRVARLELPSTGNRENAARIARYEFLTATALADNCRWIATAHHADDQAETVLHRLIRGTGLRGLRGIAPIRTDGPIPILRPLLKVSRAEILEFLALRGQSFRTDSTNADTRFTRNRLRAEVLPLLKSLHPGVVAALGRTAEQAAEMFAEEEERGLSLLARVELAPGEFELSKLDHFQDSELRQLFRALWRRERWPELGMSAMHWQSLAELAKASATARDFPGGVSARLHRGKLTLARQTRDVVE